jgi:hypothetical protein
MPGAGDYFLDKIGYKKKQDKPVAPPAPTEPTFKTTQEKIRYYSPENRQAREAAAKKAAEQKAVKELNPVDPGASWLTRLLNSKSK